MRKSINRFLTLGIIGFIALLSHIYLSFFHTNSLLSLRLISLIICLVSYLIIIISGFNLNVILKSFSDSLDKANHHNLNTRINIEGPNSFKLIAQKINSLIIKMQKFEIEEKQKKESLKKLFSNLSHDLRTPITSILGYVEALIDNVQAEQSERERYLQIIQRKAIDTKELMENIFEFSKLESGDYKLNPDTYDIGEIVRETLLESFPEISKSNRELDIKIPDIYLPALIDKESFMRALRNIISNSLLHGKNSTQMGVALQKYTQHYIIEIWDNGQGIQEEDLPYLFDRLYMCDKTRNKNRNGSGLGLSITKELIEKNNGEIAVFSKPYERTAFKITLPVSSRTF